VAVPSAALELVPAPQQEWDPLAHTDTMVMPVITDDGPVRVRSAPLPRGPAGRPGHGRHRKPTPRRRPRWRILLCAVLAVAAAMVVGTGLFRVLGDAAAPVYALAVDPAVRAAPAAAQMTNSAPPHPEPVSYWSSTRKHWHPRHHRQHYRHHHQDPPKPRVKRTQAPARPHLRTPTRPRAQAPAHAPTRAPARHAAPKPKPAPKPAPKAAPKPAPKPVVKAAPKPAPKPVAKAAPKAAPKPAPKPVAAPKPAPAPAIACGLRQLAGTQPNVSAAGRALMARFAIPEAKVLGRGSRGTAGSDHPAGLALDFMVPAIGDRLADYVLAHRAELGVTYVIWRQRINLGSGWQAMADRGSATANHMDHVHVSFRTKAC
jgi:hypothetical protein